MKRFLQPAILPFFVLGASGVGIALRIWLMLGGTDKNGLLVAGHPAQTLLWILVAVVFGVLFLFTQNLKRGPKYAFNYPPSVIGALGTGAAAVGILLVSIHELSTEGDTLASLCAFLGLGCTTLLAVIALCRWKGYRYSVILHGLVCIYAMLHLVCKYRIWSSEPQLLTYCFPLFCHASLALAVFYRVCFDADNGKRRALAISHLATAFFGLVSIPGSQDWFYYLAVSIWMLTGLCNLAPASSNGPSNKE